MFDKRSHLLTCEALDNVLPLPFNNGNGAWKAEVCLAILDLHDDLVLLHLRTVPSYAHKRPFWDQTVSK